MTAGVFVILAAGLAGMHRRQAGISLKGHSATCGFDEARLMGHSRATHGLPSASRRGSFPDDRTAGTRLKPLSSRHVGGGGPRHAHTKKGVSDGLSVRHSGHDISAAVPVI
jgi:hypothetical protein